MKKLLLLAAVAMLAAVTSEGRHVDRELLHIDQLLPTSRSSRNFSASTTTDLGAARS